jgi:hypothetical protein
MQHSLVDIQKFVMQFVLKGRALARPDIVQEIRGFSPLRGPAI